MEKSTGRAPQPRCDDVIIARVPSTLSQSLKRAAGGNLSAYMRQALFERLTGLKASPIEKNIEGLISVPTSEKVAAVGGRP